MPIIIIVREREVKSELLDLAETKKSCTTTVAVMFCKDARELMLWQAAEASRYCTP